MRYFRRRKPESVGLDRLLLRGASARLTEVCCAARGRRGRAQALLKSLTFYQRTRPLVSTTSNTNCRNNSKREFNLEVQRTAGRVGRM